MTVTVWVLYIVAMSNFNAYSPHVPAPVVIDNFASWTDCNTAGQYIMSAMPPFYSMHSTCVLTKRLP